MILSKSLYDKSLDTIENELLDVYTREEEKQELAKSISKRVENIYKKIELDYAEVMSVSKIIAEEGIGLFVKLDVGYFSGNDENDYKDEHAKVTVLLLVGEKQRVISIISDKEE